MNDLIANFPTQLKEALVIGSGADLRSHGKEIKNILICGMGGSGIGGTIASQITQEESRVPIAVNKNYIIPKYVGENSLVIISSYSGDTEESLAAMKEGLKRKAKMVCIISGGKILKAAKQKKIDHIVIPGGMPPRSALAYSLTSLFFVLHFYKVIPGNFKREINNIISIINKEEKRIQKEAFLIAKKIYGKIPVIHTDALTEGIGIRFRQQLNENAKMLGWNSVVPEMNHNELMGWRENNKNLTSIFFRHNNEHERNKRRIDITKKIVGSKSAGIIEIRGKGNSPFEEALYLIHVGDWISFYLSEMNKVDATDITAINYLKKELSKFS